MIVELTLMLRIIGGRERTMKIRPRIAMLFLSMLLTPRCVYLDMTYDNRHTTRQPHIVVIIADDLGWNDVGFHGADEIPTPNIDALAYNGVILNRHYVLPICTPSRTAFLTGRHSIRTGMQGYPLRAAEPRGIPLNNTLLPEYLQRLGYVTHLVGKWHVGYHTWKHGPARRGFDTFFGYYNGYVTYYNHTLTNGVETGYDLHRVVGDEHVAERRGEYMTDLIAGEAENIILSHDPATPLYLQLAHLAVHSTDSEEIMEVRSWQETNATLGYIKDVNRRKYASVVATLDESVGRVVGALSKAGMLENSIILFMSDNGAQTEGFLKNYGSNYPLRGLKFSLMEGGVRGAACVYSPLIESPSRVSRALFHITDWLPTLYAAAGGNSSELQYLDGVDQWATIKNAERGSRNSLLLNIDEVANAEAALIGRYKLVKDTSEYQNYYGSSGRDPSYPKYRVRDVLASQTASAIDSITNVPLKPNQIMRLRKNSKVSCYNVEGFSACVNRTCLFDVFRDPCEITDLSAKNPKIVKKLSTFIDSYKSLLMKQTNAPVDPAGFPSNFNGNWMPWLSDDYEPIHRTHLANELPH